MKLNDAIKIAVLPGDGTSFFIDFNKVAGLLRYRSQRRSMYYKHQASVFANRTAVKQSSGLILVLRKLLPFN